jgi:NADH dehydrogenase
VAFTIFRPSLIYGKADAFTNPLASLMRPPLSWLSGGFVPIPGGEEVILQPVGVNEVAEALVRSLGQTAAVGQTFDLCGKAVSLKDLSVWIAQVMGRFPTWVEQPPDVILGMLPWLWLRASKPVLFPVPLKLCRIAAAVMERVLPHPPLTTDQITMLEEGQCGDASPAAKLLGFYPAPLRDGLAAYLAPRTGGREDRPA